MRKAVFTMGAPAAGKSTWVNKNLATSMAGIDPDLVLVTLDGYDPKGRNAKLRNELHHKSKLIANSQFAQMVNGQVSFYVDGTGTNFAPLIQKIRTAKLAGFQTELVYVTCTIEQSIQRNAKRARTVPLNVIRDKFESIEIAFEVLSKEVDAVQVIDNSRPQQDAQGHQGDGGRQVPLKEGEAP